MDNILINQMSIEELKKQGITATNIFILEKPWGYVVQAMYDKMNQANGIFDKKGNIICPFESFFSDSGEIYNTEIEEMNYLKYGKIPEKQVITHKPHVQYKELDKNHFIIPRARENSPGPGNALFYISEDGKINYKGYIEGRIAGSVLTENKKLSQSKQLFVYADVDKEKDECDNYFYSWEKNCRTSDKWNILCPPESLFSARDILANQLKLPFELVDELTEYMKSTEAWLSALMLNSKNNKHHRNFICLIGIDGKPLIDLTYVSQTYAVDSIPLKKQEVGEVDNIKTLLQQRMDKQAEQIEQNKQNLATNFLKTAGLPMKNAEVITDKTDINDDDWAK